MPSIITFNDKEQEGSYNLYKLNAEDVNALKKAHNNQIFGEALILDGTELTFSLPYVSGTVRLFRGARLPSSAYVETSPTTITLQGDYADEVTPNDLFVADYQANP